jgi:predicted nucleic acid-binding protein
VKLLDANIFLRYLVAAETPRDVEMQQGSTRLLDALAADLDEALTSDLVIHEVLYILTSKSHYGLSKEEAVGRLRSILGISALALPRKALVIEAMELFGENSFLDFPDAMLIVTAREDAHEIVSFDRGLSRIRGVRRSEP